MNSEEWETFQEWHARQRGEDRWRPQDEARVDDGSYYTPADESDISSDVERMEIIADTANPNFTGPQLNHHRRHNHRRPHSRTRSPKIGRFDHRSSGYPKTRSRSRSRSSSIDRKAAHIVSVVDVSPRMLTLDRNGELTDKACEDWVDIMRQVLKQNRKIQLHQWIAPRAKTYIGMRFRQAWPQMVETGDDWTKWSHEMLFSHILKIWNKHSRAHIELSLEA